MSLGDLVKSWSETISIEVPTTSVANEYNQYSYSSSSISGRLIETEEEIVSANGEKIIAKAKLFTRENLQINTKVGDYKIFSKKECKNKKNVVEFYKYLLNFSNR